MNNIKRDADEIRKQADTASDNAPMFGGDCPYPGMSYSDGVAVALAWVLGDSDDVPMEDD